MSTSFSMDGAGTLIAGIAVICYGVILLKLILSLWTIMLFIVCIAAGLIFNAALDIIHCSLIVLTVADGGIRGIITAYLRFAEYPLEIYPKYFQILFIALLPLAIFIYYPTQALLGRIDFQVVFCIVGVIAFFTLSLRLWNTVLKKYVSAGG